jgi:hypothetical protein
MEIERLLRGRGMQFQPRQQLREFGHDIKSEYHNDLSGDKHRPATRIQELAEENGG